MKQKYKIEFLKNDKGISESEEYIKELINKSFSSKDARIKINKITEYLDGLEKFGVAIGQPVVKHIKDELYELRPLRDRFFFFYQHENKYIMLNHFIKKTQKTPQREIDKAFRLVVYYNKKGNNYGQI